MCAGAYTARSGIGLRVYRSGRYRFGRSGSRRAKSKKVPNVALIKSGDSQEIGRVGNPVFSAFHYYGNEFVCVNAAVQGWHIHVQYASQKSERKYGKR